MRRRLLVPGLVFLALVVVVAVGWWVWWASRPSPRREPMLVAHASVTGATAAWPREEIALQGLLQWARSANPAPAAIVLTTNLGMEATPPTPAAPAPAAPPAAPAAGGGGPTPPTTPAPAPAPAAAPAAGAAAQSDLASAQRFLALFKKEPSSIPVYLVPGLRDVPGDANAALTAWRAIVGEIRKGLVGTPGATQVVDLTSCYGAAAASGASCVAALQGRVRLVGYPGLYGAGLTAVQDPWTATFGAAMDAAEPGVVTILIAPRSTPLEPRWPAGAARDAWMRAAGNAQVVLGVEGSPATGRGAFERTGVWRAPGLVGQWLVTPPLVTQEPSGSSASQGASVIAVSRDGVSERGMLWYGDTGTTFLPLSLDAERDGSHRRRGPWAFVTSPIRWLWDLGNGISSSLSKFAVLCIALLAAFLTAVGIWQIPTPTSASVTTTGTTQTTTTTTTTAGTTTVVKPSLLDSNFARTVVSGLGGLALATLMLDAFESADSKGPSQQFYVVWFTVWFFFWLLGSSLIKAVAEGFRAISHISRTDMNAGGAPAKDRRWRAVKFRWFWLTTTDAFFNLIQGRNQLQPTLWAQAIKTTQEDVLVAIDRICEHLRAGFADYLNDRHECPCCREKSRADGAPATAAPATPPAAPATPPAAPATPAEGAPPPVVPPASDACGTCGSRREGRVEISEIRVAVSVLSDDRQRVYYVSWPPESSSRDFPVLSVAYTSVFAGAVRWWMEGLNDEKRKVVLLGKDEVSALGLGTDALMLSKAFASRGQDYKSFVVIPIPLRRTEEGRRAGLHISFKRPDAVRTIWGKTPDVPELPADLSKPVPGADTYYAEAANFIDDTPPELDRLLRQSLNVIESVLRHFNEEVFVNVLHSRRRA